MEDRQRGKGQPIEEAPRIEAIAVQVDAGMKRCVGLGVVAVNLIDIGKALG